MMVDTNCICGLDLKGGKLGMFEFSQENVTWSNLKYRCLGKCTLDCGCNYLNG